MIQVVDGDGDVIGVCWGQDKDWRVMDCLLGGFQQIILSDL